MFAVPQLYRYRSRFCTPRLTDQEYLYSPSIVHVQVQVLYIVLLKLFDQVDVFSCIAVAVIVQVQVLHIRFLEL